MPCQSCSNQADDFDPECEGVSEADLARFGGDSAPCPGCGADLYDDAKWCPKCGRVLSEDEIAGDRGAKTWVVVTAIVVVAGFLFFLVF